MDDAVAVLFDLDHFCGEPAVAKDDLSALGELPAGLGQTLPPVVTQVPQQKQLGGAAGGTVAQEPGGQNSGVVHHQGIAGIQIIENIVKMPVCQFAGPAVHSQQPGSIPLLQGRLGDQFLRQVVPEVPGLKIGHNIRSFFHSLFIIAYLVLKIHNKNFHNMVSFFYLQKGYNVLLFVTV